MKEKAEFSSLISKYRTRRFVKLIRPPALNILRSSRKPNSRHCNTLQERTDGDVKFLVSGPNDFGSTQ